MGLVNLRDGSMLIASADEVQRTSLMQFLTKAGYKKIQLVASAKECLLSLQQKTPDLFVLSDSITDIPTLSLLQAIRQSKRSLQILALVDTTQNPASSFSETGANHVCKIPLQERQVISALEQMMMVKLGIAVSSIAERE